MRYIICPFTFRKFKTRYYAMCSVQWKHFCNPNKEMQRVGTFMCTPSYMVVLSFLMHWKCSNDCAVKMIRSNGISWAHFACLFQFLLTTRRCIENFLHLVHYCGRRPRVYHFLWCFSASDASTCAQFYDRVNFVHSHFWPRAIALYVYLYTMYIFILVERFILRLKTLRLKSWLLFILARFAVYKI